MTTEFRDASDAIVRLPIEPVRIVSLVPSVTETLFALGLGSRVVGVTDWCLHPQDELAGLARVGGTKNPNLAAIEERGPDLIIANLEENREIDVRRLRERGLTVWVDFPRTVADVITQVRQMAEMGAPPPLARALLDRLQRAADRARSRQDGEKRCFIAVWKDPWMTISAATYAHDLLTHLGMANVFAQATQRYPRVTLDDIAARDPEVILLPDEPYSFNQEHVRELKTRLAKTTAARRNEIHLIDGTLAFWHGPRTARALNEGLFPRAR